MPQPRRIAPLTLLATLAMLGPASAVQAPIGPEAPLSAEGVRAMEALIEHEMEAKGIPCLSIAIVDGDQIVWARGFGTSDIDGETPASAETVYRVGSVSKLFTDIAALQFVEAGELDLDAPITDVLLDFRPENPFDAPVTLRHLMSHRAGVVREPPVGHYFDPTGPGIAATVASLNRTALVFPPGDRTKYSNAGVSVVGRVVEAVAGRPFAEHLRGAILEPLGMDSSSFERTPEVETALADALMWGYDGREFPAPDFRLGTLPAGNLYASVADLGRLLIALLNMGQGQGGRILKGETLASMWEPQFEEDGPFGLGFAVSEWEGHRRVGHGGAVYGFSTEFAALPDERLGVAVASARDVTNAVARRITDAAFEVMLACRSSDAIPTFETTDPLPDGLARELRGRFADEEGAVAELLERDGRLFLLGPDGGFELELRRPADTEEGSNRLIVDGPLVAFGREITCDGETLTDGDATYRRLPDDEPPPRSPERWDGLIGEYGWDHNILFVLEREGSLYALIEWVFFDQLEEVEPGTFAFPDSGLYEGERLIFERDPSGKASAAIAAGIRFERRPIDGEDGSTFQIEPLRPVAELRPEALAASPPEEAGPFRDEELVDLKALEPSIRLDIRYATDNNFVGTPFYSSARAFLQAPAAEAAARAHRALEPISYGLLIHDAYRPWYVTKMFWEASPEAARGFVADPSKGSKHNRGCAVDLTLFDRASGAPVPMVAGYDEFSERAGPYYPGGTTRQRWHRHLLRHAMEAEGFDVISTEWWHFDYKDWPSYAIQNRPFEAIDIAEDAP